MKSTKQKLKKIEKLKKDLKVPIYIFDDRILGPLECLVKYLRDELEFKNSVIAKILNRDDRTIWTVYNRVKQKK